MIRFRFVDDAQKNHSVKRLCESTWKLNRLVVLQMEKQQFNS